MDNTRGFLNRLRELPELRQHARRGRVSDYAVAKFLEITPQQMSKYANGKEYLSDPLCIIVADALGLEAGYVLNSIAAERAKNEVVKRAWRDAAKKIGAAALAVLVVVVLTSSWFDVSPLSPAEAATPPCVLCQMAAWALAVLAGLAATAWWLTRRRAARPPVAQ